MDELLRAEELRVALRMAQAHDDAASDVVCAIHQMQLRFDASVKAANDAAGIVLQSLQHYAQHNSRKLLHANREIGAQAEYCLDGITCTEKLLSYARRMARLQQAADADELVAAADGVAAFQVSAQIHPAIAQLQSFAADVFLLQTEPPARVQATRLPCAHMWACALRVEAYDNADRPYEPMGPDDMELQFLRAGERILADCFDVTSAQDGPFACIVTVRVCAPAPIPLLRDVQLRMSVRGVHQADDVQMLAWRLKGDEPTLGNTHRLLVPRGILGAPTTPRIVSFDATMQPQPRFNYGRNVLALTCVDTASVFVQELALCSTWEVLHNDKWCACIVYDPAIRATSVRLNNICYPHSWFLYGFTDCQNVMLTNLRGFHTTVDGRLVLHWMDSNTLTRTTIRLRGPYEVLHCTYPSIRPLPGSVLHVSRSFDADLVITGADTEVFVLTDDTHYRVALQGASYFGTHAPPRPMLDAYRVEHAGAEYYVCCFKRLHDDVPPEVRVFARDGMCIGVCALPNLGQMREFEFMLMATRNNVYALSLPLHDDDHHKSAVYVLH